MGVKEPFLNSEEGPFHVPSRSASARERKMDFQTLSRFSCERPRKKFFTPFKPEGRL
jgi:hypothetical protein